MQGLFPCGRRVRLPPSGGSRMRILRLAHPARARLSRRCAGGGRDDRDAERPARRASARSRRASRPPASTSSASTGAGPARCSSGRARSPVAGAPGRSRLPRPRTSPTRARPSARASGSWRLGNPWWVGPSDRIEYRLRGQVTKLRAFFVWSPSPGVPGRTLQKAGAPAIVPRSGWNADEKIRRGAAVVRARSAPRARAPHGRRERLHAPPSRRRSSARSSSTTSRETAGTTSATTSSSTASARSSRAATAGSSGTSSAPTPRGSTPARSASRCSASTARSRSRRRRATLSRPCSPGGSTSRTSTRRSTLSFISGGNARFPRRPARLPPHGFRPPRHRLHRLPRERALRPAHRARGRRLAARPAEAVLAARHRHRAGHGSLQGAAVVGAAVDGRCLRLGRQRRSARPPASGRTSTGPGTRRCSRPAATRTRSARRTA